MAAHPFAFASSLLALIASASMWHSTLGMTLPSSLKTMSELSATKTDACPAGYNESTKNLQGATGKKDGVTDAASCAQVCDARVGCTSFETGDTSSYPGCWTYMAEDVNVNWGSQAAGWITCIRDEPAPCPDGYDNSKYNLNGGWYAGIKSTTTDATECAAVCEAREGCTSFKVGPDTEGPNIAGCFTYISGTANVASSLQEPSWVSCIKKGVPNPFVCPDGYTLGNYDLEGETAEKDGDVLFNAQTCGLVCDTREYCKAFEVGITTSYAGCWTYTAGAANRATSAQIGGWITCSKTNTTTSSA